MFTYCNPEPSPYFTFHLCNSAISGGLQEFRSEKRRAENYKNGRERPQKLGFNPPKRALGRSRPFRKSDTARRRTEVTSASNALPAFGSLHMAICMSFVLRPAWQAHRKENHLNANLEGTTKADSQFHNPGPR